MFACVPWVWYVRLAGFLLGAEATNDCWITVVQVLGWEEKKGRQGSTEAITGCCVVTQFLSVTIMAPELDLGDEWTSDSFTEHHKADDSTTCWV